MEEPPAGSPGFDTPGFSKENVEPPMTGRKRFSPGFSPLGRRSQRRNTGPAPADAPAGRRTAQRSLRFGDLDAEQSKPEEGGEAPAAQVTAPAPAALPGPAPAPLAPLQHDAASQPQAGAGREERWECGPEDTDAAEPARAPTAPAGWSAQDMPEDGAPVCAAVHGVPEEGEALAGRDVLLGC